MLKLQEVKNREILLDSNILINYASEGFKDRSGNILRTLINNGNKISVSPVSGFEVLRGDNRKETDEKYIKFLKYIPNVKTQDEYFSNAAVLARHYNKNCNKKIIPTEDLLIGSIVATHSFGVDSSKKILLLTADRTDFCEPVWLTVAYQIVPPNNGNSQVNLFLLEFNTEIIKE